MDTRYQLIRQLADGNFHSGEILARSLGISRAAVWKQLQGLRGLLEMDIHAVSGRGYRLSRPLELLEREHILDCLTPVARARISLLEIHHHIESTNAHLMARAAAGAPSGQVCLAEQQSGGRGRRGRPWVSPFGSNIYLSVLWRYPLAPAELGGLSLAAGLAVVRALGRFGVEGIGVKWPNDILWKNRKLAGLLLEVAGENEGPSQVVLGIGINTRLSSRQGEAIDQPWADLAAIPGGGEITRNHLAAELLEQLLPALDDFEAHGLPPLLEEWRRHDLHHGKKVTLQLGGRTIKGIHRGIDETGALRLAIGGEVRAFHAGEVSLRPDPGA